MSLVGSELLCEPFVLSPLLEIQDISGSKLLSEPLLSVCFLKFVTLVGANCCLSPCVLSLFLEVHDLGGNEFVFKAQSPCSQSASSNLSPEWEQIAVSARVLSLFLAVPKVIG